jgi:hypothetical protein
MLVTQDRFAHARLAEHRFVVPDRLPPFWNGERAGDHSALSVRFAAAAEGLAMVHDARLEYEPVSSLRLRDFVRGVRGSRRS